MRRADIKRQNTSVLIINASCFLRVKSKRPLPPPPPPPPRDNVVKKGRKKERKEREEKLRQKRGGGESKEREKLEQTKRGDRAATYLGAALQKQERPTRQLGNDPAL